MKILGLDPGLNKTGWGVITFIGNRLSYIAHGVITPTSSASLAQRLAELFESLQNVIQSYRPDTSAVEETFVNMNARSTLKLGQARGVILLAPATSSIPVFEYATNQVKKTVVGVGHADKRQVKTMVKFLLPTCPDLTDDAADALAVAICHAQHSQTYELLKKVRR